MTSNIKEKRKQSIESETMDPSFSFVSLYLFVLIFFILLVSYAKINNSESHISKVFKSFRGENIEDNKVILLTSAEEQVIVSRQSYQKLINSFMDVSHALPQTPEEYKETRVYKLKFPLEAFFEFSSIKLTDHAKQYLEYLEHISSADPTYPLEIDINYHIKGKIEPDNPEIKRLNNLSAKIISLPKKHGIFTVKAISSNSNYITIDILMKDK